MLVGMVDLTQLAVLLLDLTGGRTLPLEHETSALNSQI